MSLRILNGEFADDFLKLDRDLHGLKAARQQKPRRDPLANQDVRKHLVQMGATNREHGIRGMQVRDRNGFIATFRGEHFFLHQRQQGGRRKVEHVYRAGDLLSKNKVNVRWLQHCSNLPDRLRDHLAAYEADEPSPLVAILCTFLEIPEPELEIGRRIVRIDAGALELVFVVWFDGKTAVEFAGESFREKPTIVNIDLNLERTANALKGAEFLAKIEYYVLSSLAAPVAGAAKAIGKGIARRATLLTYKGIASKSMRRLVFKTLRDFGKAFSGAIAKSSFKAGGSFYKSFHQELTSLRIQKGQGNAPTDGEVAVIAQKAGVEAYKDFILTLIKETLVKKALAKNDLTFKTASEATYGEQFVTLMVRTIYEQFSVEIASGSATLLGEPAVAAYKKARSTDGLDAAVFQREFVAELEKALNKWLVDRGKAIGDAAVKSLTERAITML